MSKRAYILAIFFIIVTLLVAACGGDDEQDSDTERDRVQDARTALAAATPTPTVRPTATPRPSIEGELARTVARMANAVEGGDVERYFEFVADTDPFFVQEHRHWAEFWEAQPFDRYALDINSIKEISETEALARMIINWTHPSGELVGVNGANVTVRFVKSPETDEWLFAGEAWEIARAFWDGTNWTVVFPEDDVPDNSEERIRVYYLPEIGAIEGTREAAEKLLADLPGVYNVVSTELDYIPQEIIHIRFYDFQINLRAMTDLRLRPSQIYVNLPGLPMKIIVVPETDSQPPSIESMSTSLAESMLHEMSQDNPDTPSWLMLGATEFVTAQNYRTQTFRNNQIENVLALLPDTEAIEPEDSPLLTGPSISVGTVLLMYIDETYEAQSRREWLKAILGDGQSLEDATDSVLGVSFDELNEGFMRWLGDELDRIQ
ncbi:MAG: hypothetical protein L0154_24795 [Chloroflexi bacterium]|nr:hypothetical protein [Chloroflexota bacterium]